MRTAIALHVTGAWDEAVTFPNKATAHWERVAARDHLGCILENLDFARARGAGSAPRALLERVVRR